MVKLGSALGEGAAWGKSPATSALHKRQIPDPKPSREVSLCKHSKYMLNPLVVPILLRLAANRCSLRGRKHPA